MRYPVLLFDLFRTILMFTPQAPTGQVREAGWRAAMGALRGRAAPLLGGIEFDFFLDALYDVSVAIAKARPPEHLEVPIEERYTRALARLGCEGPAAAVTAAGLARHGLDRILTTAVISIDLGRRKPHPAIFREALRRLDASAESALFVGDSLDDDIAGARSAGIDGAWVNWSGAALPAEAVPPTFVLRSLTELRGVLQ